MTNQFYRGTGVAEKTPKYTVTPRHVLEILTGGILWENDSAGLCYYSGDGSDSAPFYVAFDGDATLVPVSERSDTVFRFTSETLTRLAGAMSAAAPLID